MWKSANRKLAFPLFVLTILIVFSNASSSSVIGQDANSDAKKIMALMRLKSVDVNKKPKLKEIVIRHMAAETDEQQWLKLADRFQIPESVQRATDIAIHTSHEANAAAALQLIEQLGQLSTVFDRIQATKAPLDPEEDPNRDDPSSRADKKPKDELAADIRAAESLANRLRLLKSEVIDSWIWQQIADVDRYPTNVATPLARCAAALPQGAEKFLEMADQETLPASIRLAVSSALSRHPDPEIQQRAAKILPLPQTGNMVLAPLEELVKRRGDIANGMKVFAGAGTCAKCHVVNGQGSSVGPDLSEIGNKLARDAMYTAILDPSAAISHNYENYAVQSIDGKLFTGLLVSETKEKVILKSADGVPQEILQDDIDEMQRLNMSLMPADLIRAFSEQDLVDLVEYLTTLKKVNQ